MKQIFVVAIAIVVIGASVPGAVRAQIAPPVQDALNAIDGTATHLTHALLTFDAAGASFKTGRLGLIHCVTATAGAWSSALGQLKVPPLRTASNNCTPASSVAASLGTVNGFASTVGGATASANDGSSGSPKFAGNGSGNGGSGVHVSPSSNDTFNGGVTAPSGDSTGGNGGSGSITAGASTPGGDPGNGGTGPITGDNTSGSVTGGSVGNSGSTGNVVSGSTSGSGSTGGSGGTTGTGSGIQGNGSHGNGADSHGVGRGNGAGLEGDKSGIGHKEKAK